MLKFPKGVYSRGKREVEKILDKVFSLYIRFRDNWTCQRCGKRIDPSITSLRKEIQCSHYYGRRWRYTRYHEDNCVALCRGCHYYHWEGEKAGEYRDYMIKRLGKKKFEDLEMLNGFDRRSGAKCLEVGQMEVLLIDFKKKLQFWGVKWE